MSRAENDEMHASCTVSMRAVKDLLSGMPGPEAYHHVCSMGVTVDLHNRAVIT